MSYLLDTNVISELRKSPNRADASVRRWVSAHPVREYYLSVLTVLEIELGIHRAARRDSTQAARLQLWLDEDVLESFVGRILPVDVPVARRAAQMHVPDPRPERDALIAATASIHGLSVVTRNVKDFGGLTVPVINPWDSAAD